MSPACDRIFRCSLAVGCVTPNLSAMLQPQIARIYYTTEEQKHIAEAYIQQWNPPRLGGP